VYLFLVLHVCVEPVRLTTVTKGVINSYYVTNYFFTQLHLVLKLVLYMFIKMGFYIYIYYLFKIYVHK